MLICQYACVAGSAKNLMNSQAPCCSSGDLLFIIHKLAPPTTTPPSLEPSGLGKNPVPTSNLPSEALTIPRREAVESRVIAICPAAKAFFVSSVLRPRLMSVLSSSICFHQVRIETPASLFTKEDVAGVVRPFPLSISSIP
ncbi:hypothetical protein D3C76_1369190 [compost metagenome]